MSPDSSVSVATTELRRRITAAVVAPLVLLVAVAIALTFQVARLREDARWIDHTDQVVATINLTYRQIVDQETSLRGYLLTGSRIYLDPYSQAHPDVLLERLRGQVVDNPDQVLRADELSVSYARWRDEAEAIVRPGAEFREALRPEALQARKGRMDDLRLRFAEMLEIEAGLRQRRVAASENSAATARLVFVGLLGGAAIALAVFSRRQLVAITATFRAALGREQAARATLADEEWIRRGQLAVAEAVQGDLTPADVAGRALAAIADHAGAAVGAFFTREGTGWRRAAGFALDAHSTGSEAFASGEGLVGRAGAGAVAVHVTDVPERYFALRSGTGAAAPSELLVVPARREGVVHGVVEVGFLGPTPARARALIERAAETAALGLRDAELKARLRDLLEEAQRQAEELQTQQEELRVANEELAEQGTALRDAQARLEERKEQLEALNARLLARTRELDDARRVTEAKAEELERASRVKSEFLANMSHELRTPLNSTLILAKLLADNKGANLTPEQVRFAETIHSAGNDLLTLINDVLDLSKIEAGKMDVTFTEVAMVRVADSVRRTFEPVARERSLEFVVEVDVSAGASLRTDALRLEQILRNLLSNALKFTERGRVSLRVEGDERAVRFIVEDTGIGIATDQQTVVFEAFRQADGTTSRKYGGTGLGLSISRDLARLLGGEIVLASELGHGSRFTVTLPRVPNDPVAPRARVAPSAHRAFAREELAMRADPARPNVDELPFADDRDAPRDRRRVLIVEDDLAFAEILLALARELGFHGVVATTAAGALRMAEARAPDAVILDVNLPDRSGLAVLDRLKQGVATRHVPVHVVSAVDHTHAAHAMGAIGYLVKPATREALAAAFHALEQRLAQQIRRVLVVEDDAAQRTALEQLLTGPGVEITSVGTVARALEALGERTWDCVVTDLALPDASGFDLLAHMAQRESAPFPPVIVYTGRSLSADEETELRRYSDSIIVKGARSPERLLDEVTLFLHQVESTLPAERQRMLARARDREAAFEGRTVMVVEDDVRNVFALSSILEPRGVKVVLARNGREALEVLARTPGVDLVLMDLMMPEMDGLEATRRIRAAGRHARLPIIALTAKAMRDDRERCLAAGASDYITKPVDVEMLVSLLRVWMPR